MGPQHEAGAPDTLVDDTIDSLSRESRTIAGYRLIARIGRGGQADVYAATRLEDGVRVALKLLPDPSPTAAERLRREASAALKLDHPNVVRVHDFGASAADNTAYIAMELLAGESLAERIERAPVDLSLTFHVLRGIAAALEAAHALGIVHRDLKPANVFLTGSATRPQVKVMDFGIARFDARWDATRLTATGALVGTPHYMSPEQIAGDEGLTPASDLYALGVIAYRLITGRLPFPGPTVQEVLTAHLSAPPPEEPLRARVSGPVADAILATLAKDARERPPGVRAFMARLPSGSGPAPRTRLAWIVAAIAALALGGGAWLWVAGQRPPSEQLASWVSAGETGRARAYAYALQNAPLLATDRAAMAAIEQLLATAQPAGPTPYDAEHRLAPATYLGTLGRGALLLTLERIESATLWGRIESADPPLSVSVHGFWRGNHAIMGTQDLVFEVAFLDAGATVRGSGPAGAPLRAVRR